ncbi:uncharacterized protein SCHCODRAFT_02693832 [Schizophyllum commune H4-8]|uniref:uncharacterized protein n=1 Tax=Schizophyllum commune (strain H4-8 / FGSC 9210) TaxID=578458 RepID=UPI00215DD88E|nr:uncharacterized protein SCHCODRAFT_02693832 [Schizophyllum commune H4-8]KAI5885670.1 hypothetical protein SCHCODRAFT_02693832 [Schizophyllum commune H4-8]
MLPRGMQRRPTQYVPKTHTNRAKSCLMRKIRRLLDVYVRQGSDSALCHARLTPGVCLQGHQDGYIYLEGCAPYLNRCPSPPHISPEPIRLLMAPSPRKKVSRPSKVAPAVWARNKLAMLPLDSTPPPESPRLGHGVECPVRAPIFRYASVSELEHVFAAPSHGESELELIDRYKKGPAPFGHGGEFSLEGHASLASDDDEKTEADDEDIDEDIQVGGEHARVGRSEHRHNQAIQDAASEPDEEINVPNLLKQLGVNDSDDDSSDDDDDEHINPLTEDIPPVDWNDDEPYQPMDIDIYAELDAFGMDSNANDEGYQPGEYLISPNGPSLSARNPPRLPANYILPVNAFDAGCILRQLYPRVQDAAAHMDSIPQEQTLTAAHQSICHCKVPGCEAHVSIYDWWLHAYTHCPIVDYDDVIMTLPCDGDPVDHVQCICLACSRPFEAADALRRHTKKGTQCHKLHGERRRAAGLEKDYWLSLMTPWQVEKAADALEALEASD